MISINLKKKLKYFNLDISFSCTAGTMLVMIGPSGGGKTSIIRMIAGLDQPDEGKIVFKNEVWFDSAECLFKTPQKRRVGYVFQDYTLFPHLNLYENAAFAAADRDEVDELFDLFKINHLRNRKPHLVSGGERQRCAICQALATRPRVLLMDEPFSALDVVTRRDLREELRNLKGRFSFPVIYVTHDINEALFLADEILPVVDGTVDAGWIKRTINRNSASVNTPRAVRDPKLALSY